jgi:hypothetical protein
MAVRWLRWISGAVWAFSWCTIYLEIFRWHHITRSLRFQAPTPANEIHAPARAGWPVRAIRLASFAAPVVFLTAVAAGSPPARPPPADRARARRSRRSPRQRVGIPVRVAANDGVHDLGMHRHPFQALLQAISRSWAWMESPDGISVMSHAPRRGHASDQASR